LPGSRSDFRIAGSRAGSQKEKIDGDNKRLVGGEICSCLPDLGHVVSILTAASRSSAPAVSCASGGRQVHVEVADTAVLHPNGRGPSIAKRRPARLRCPPEAGFPFLILHSPLGAFAQVNSGETFQTLGGKMRTWGIGHRWRMWLSPERRAQR